MLIVESLSAIHLTADRSGTAGDEWRLKGKRSYAKQLTEQLLFLPGKLRTHFSRRGEDEIEGE